MLVQADVKGLEVVGCAFLSRDATLMEEVVAGVDFHESNRVRFGLPSRTVAKRFKFKLIYGATAYGYANDSDFIDVSDDQDFWQGIINEYYAKYSGVQDWHKALVAEAIQHGVHRNPTGREYNYPSQDVALRMWFWRPKILNYPVQGLGADLVMLARVSFWNRINRLGLRCLPILSVHDSIVADVDTSLETCYNIGKILKSCIEDIPKNFKKLFGVDFDLPLTAEIKAGNDLHNMEVIECK